jgi:VWFA-related protein
MAETESQRKSAAGQYFAGWIGIGKHMRLIGSRALFCMASLGVSMALSTVAGAQEQSNSGGEYTLHLNSNLVILSATVLDRHNALVSGLDEGAFQIYEDRVLQRIKHFSHEDLPVTAGLVIDNSGSMGPKRADVIAAALSFARSSNPRDQMFVVNFNEHVSFGLPANEPFTDRGEQLQVALSSTHTVGETALYDGIATALDHLKQGKCDKKVLILISDGGDNASKSSLAQVLEMAKRSDAIIYAIGIFDDQDGDQNPGVLKRLAKETGGEAFFPASSAEISPICEQIARDIRNQYTLAYIPTVAKQDGAYREVEVKASSPGLGRLSVRTRAGYSLPASQESPVAGRAGHDTHK